MLERITTRVSAFFANPADDKPRDYRWIIGLVLICYFITLLVSHFFFHDYKFLWRFMGVPAFKEGLFHDLKVITYAMDCLRLGIDPLYEKGCYPGVHFNYPTFWYYLRYTGLASQHTKVLAVLLITLFLIVLYFFIGKVSIRKSVFYSFILISPPVMLAIERCNNDMLFFAILYCALLLSKTRIPGNFLSYGLILLSGILKIHPVFAFSLALKEKKRTLITIVLPLITLFILIIILNLPMLLQSSLVTPRPYELFSFGSNVIGYYYFQEYLDIQEYLINIKLISWSVSFIFILFIAFTASKLPYSKPDEGFSMDAFRLGASMYIGNFLIGNNYDYRLIFLLFCLPQVFIWLQKSGFQRNLAAIFILTMILLFHFPSVIRHLMPENWNMPVKAVFYWGLFGISLVLFLHSLPVNRFTKLFFRPSSQEFR